MRYDSNEVYEMVPPSMRSRYGSTKGEIAHNYIIEHPEMFLDITDTQDLMDFIVKRLVSDVGEYIALKGGYVVKMMSKLARYTVDIDLSVNSKEDYVPVLESLISSAELIINLGADNYETKKISEGSSGGIKIYKKIEGSLREVVSVDVGLHDLSYGVTTSDEFFKHFTIERMLCDKLSALMSQQRYRRMKDLYDVWLFKTFFQIDYNELLKIAVIKSVSAKLPTDTELVEMNKAYNKLKVDRINDKLASEIVSFKDAIRAYGQVLYELEEARKNAKHN